MKTCLHFIGFYANLHWCLFTRKFKMAAGNRKWF